MDKDERIRKLLEDIEIRNKQYAELQKSSRGYIDYYSENFKKIRELIEYDEYSKEEILKQIYELVKY